MDKNKTASCLSSLKYIFGILRKHDILVPVLMVLSVCTQAVLPLWKISIPKQLLDLLMSAATAETLLMRIIQIGIITVLLSLLATWIEQKYEMRIGLARTNVFRVMLMRKLFRMKYATLESPKTRKLVDHAWGASWSNNHGVEGSLRHLSKCLGGILTLAGLSATLFTLHPLIPPALILMSVFDQLALRRKSKIQLDNYDDNKYVDRRLDYVNETMQDMSYGKEIRIMGMGTFLNKWRRQLMNKKLALLQSERQKCMPFDVAQIILAVLRETLVYGYLIYAVWSKGVSVANFTFYFAAALSFSGTLIDIITHWEALHREARCMEDMRAMMELPDETGTSDQFDVTDFLDKPVVLDNVSFRYPSATNDAISHINYTFVPGHRVAIVGENGSGKTTLVKLLCGLIEPTEGSIRFGECDAKSLSGWARYALFNAVFQDINTYALTLGENVAMSENVRTEAAEAALEQAGLDVSAFPKGLETILRRDFDPEGIDLSGGQKQALAIARAAYHDKAIMTMLDEPTAALDPIAESRIYEHFDGLIRGKSAVFISHRLASTRFCDDVLVLRDGELVEQGNHDTLMDADGYYARMYRAQSSYYQNSPGSDGKIQIHFEEGLS